MPINLLTDLLDTFHFLNIFMRNAQLTILTFLNFNKCVLCELTRSQSWALALFLQVRSPLNFYPWIAIALLLVLQIFRFAHRSIALKKTSGLLLEKSTKTLYRS